MDDITEKFLSHLENPDREADDLLDDVYQNLRQLAAKQMARERGDHTLDPTAVVHEAYLRLVDQSRVDWRGQSHFMALAATMIRRVLVDHARKSRSSKRGGDLERVTMSVAGEPLAESRFLDVLALDSALQKLEDQSPRMSRVVDLRVFGGLEVKEVATVLGVSERTVKGDWSLARAWLAREIAEGEEEE